MCEIAKNCSKCLETCGKENFGKACWNSFKKQFCMAHEHLGGEYFNTTMYPFHSWVNISMTWLVCCYPKIPVVRTAAGVLPFLSVWVLVLICVKYFLPSSSTMFPCWPRKNKFPFDSIWNDILILIESENPVVRWWMLQNN